MSTRVAKPLRIFFVGLAVSATKVVLNIKYTLKEKIAKTNIICYNINIETIKYFKPFKGGKYHGQK